MEIADLAQSGGAQLGPTIWVVAGALALAVAGALVAVMRLTGRVNTLTGDNQDLRHAIHDLRERLDVTAEQLEYNQQLQRSHLGQIADFLELGHSPDYAALRATDAPLPDATLPDVDLHATDDYNGEPLINADPSRVVPDSRPEPDLLAQVKPLSAEMGDVADESGVDPDRVANEWYARDSANGRQA